MVGWYSRFIEKENEIQLPLLALLKKSLPWRWDEKQQLVVSSPCNATRVIIRSGLSYHKTLKLENTRSCTYIEYSPVQSRTILPPKRNASR